VPQPPLIVGYGTDKTIRHVLRTAERAGVEVSFLELGAFALRGIVAGSAHDACVRVECDGASHDLHDAPAIYQRAFPPPMDVIGAEHWRSALGRLTALTTALLWTDRLVVNPPYSGWENGSKALQTHRLHQAGFEVPASVSTSVGDDFLRFSSSRETIFKSNSGIRSVVDDVAALGGGRLELLAHCPVLFQERLRGADVRVHVVGEAAYGLHITSDAVDYRYYRTYGTYSEMRGLSALPEDVVQRCTSSARACGLTLAGFDFKIVGDAWYCLEMNPSPAFEVFDVHGGGAIAERLLQVLVAGGPATGRPPGAGARPAVGGR
jgi:hypothetical protein